MVNGLGQNRWISLKDAAEYCGFTEGSFRQMIRRGTIPGKYVHMVARRYRFKRSELDEWIRSGGNGKDGADQM